MPLWGSPRHSIIRSPYLKRAAAPAQGSGDVARLGASSSRRRHFISFHFRCQSSLKNLRRHGRVKNNYTGNPRPPRLIRGVPAEDTYDNSTFVMTAAGSTGRSWSQTKHPSSNPDAKLYDIKNHAHTLPTHPTLTHTPLLSILGDSPRHRCRRPSLASSRYRSIAQPDVPGLAAHTGSSPDRTSLLAPRPPHPS